MTIVSSYAIASSIDNAIINFNHEFLDFIPADTSTQHTLFIPFLSQIPGIKTTSEFSSINYELDHDWFRINLIAGKTYNFAVNTPSSSLDPTLTLRDQNGSYVVANDDGGVGPNFTDSHLEFTAVHGGTYYLEVGGWGSSTGSYDVTASTFVPGILPVPQPVPSFPIPGPGPEFGF
jgi:hypothetical protein